MRSTLFWERVNPDALNNREKHYLHIMTAGQKVDVWQVRMLINLTAGDAGFSTEPKRDDTSTKQIEFPVGFAAVEEKGRYVYLLCYRLRDYYRKMRLTNGMMPALKNVLWDTYDLRKYLPAKPEDEPAVKVPLLPADFRLYAEFFKRHGFKPFEIGKEEKKIEDKTDKKEARKDPIFQKQTPILFAHRGGALEQPESTKQAFQYAIEIGSDVLELDLQVTKDGKFVVWHGPHLDNVLINNVKQKGKHIKDFKWKDLKSAVVDNPPDFQPIKSGDNKMMLFSDFLTFLKAFPNVPLNVEMKKDTFKLRHVSELIGMLQPEFDAGRTINVVSQSLDLLREYRIRTQSKLTGLSSCEVFSLFVKYKLNLPLPDLTSKALQTTHLKYFTSAGLIQMVKEKGGAVHVFLNGWFPLDQDKDKLTEEAIFELLDRGVDGIMTDRPSLVRPLIDQWKASHP
jgi:glycerophosphoryl diester phosphodiesterase